MLRERDWDLGVRGLERERNRERFGVRSLERDGERGILGVKHLERERFGLGI